MWIANATTISRYGSTHTDVDNDIETGMNLAALQYDCQRTDCVTK